MTTREQLEHPQLLRKLSFVEERHGTCSEGPFVSPQLLRKLSFVEDHKKVRDVREGELLPQLLRKLSFVEDEPEPVRGIGGELPQLLRKLSFVEERCLSLSMGRCQTLSFYGS